MTYYNVDGTMDLSGSHDPRGSSRGVLYARNDATGLLVFPDGHGRWTHSLERAPRRTREHIVNLNRKDGKCVTP